MRKSKPTVLAIGVLPPPFNGMSVVFENLCQSSISQEIDLVVLNISDNRDIASIGKLDVMNVVLAFRHGYQFIRLLAKHKPDIVYAPIAQGTLGYLRDALFLVPSRLLNISVIVHLHGSELQKFYNNSSILIKILVKFTLARVKRAIVLGKGLKKEFLGLVPLERVVVIPNGIMVNGAASQISQIARKRLEVVYLGALKKRKGYQELIYAIPSILKKVPVVHFVFAGEICDQEYHCSIVNFINSNNIGSSIEFIGVVSGDAKFSLLNEADIFCFPPIEPEGQPLVILEAMACGLPIISTRYGAIPDLVLDEVNGFVIPPGNREQLIDKICHLATSPVKRLEMGRRSSELYRTQFTREKWAQQLGDLFINVVKENDQK